MTGYLRSSLAVLNPTCQRMSYKRLRRFTQFKLGDAAVPYLLIAFLFVFSCSVRADHSGYPGQFMSGNTLIRLMKEPENDFLSKGEVLGFVEAVFDDGVYSRWNILQNTKNQPMAQTPEMRASLAAMFFCEHSGINKGQLLAIVQKFLEQNPERWSEPAHRLVSEALKKAFPCTMRDLYPDSR